MTLSALGIFSAAGTGGAALVSDYELIETQILGSSQSSITFSGLATYASTYKHLQIRAVHRSSSSAGLGDFRVRFNGDTGTNYNWHTMVALDSRGVISYGVTNSNGMDVNNIQLNSVSNQYGASVVDVLDPYSTTKNKTIRTLSGAMENAADFRRYIGLFSGAWRDTSSVTSITLLSVTTDFGAGCRFSIYGVK